MLRNVAFLLMCAVVTACNDNMVFSEYKATDKGYWSKDQTYKFTFSNLDTLNPRNLFINIRNDDAFPYRNLFLITELNFPDGITVKDTLEYEMALPDGQWLGKGYGNIKENKLWYKENIVLNVKGVYTLELSQAMRKNGEVDGIENLIGITDVGFQIEKSN